MFHLGTVTFGSKLQVVFITATILIINIIAWFEILDIFDSSCKDSNFSNAFLGTRFALYLISRFYMISVMNIELLAKKPYAASVWKGLWPPAFQALSFLLLADVFTFDYVECLSYHQTFSLSTARVFCIISVIFTVVMSNQVISTAVISLKSFLQDDIEVPKSTAKCLNIALLVILCFMLSYSNIVYMILTYSQLSESTPLLYIETVLYHGLLLIYIGRAIRTLFKRFSSKPGTRAARNTLKDMPGSQQVSSEPTTTPEQPVNNSIEMVTPEQVS